MASILQIAAKNIFANPANKEDTFMLNETLGLAPEWSYNNDVFYKGESTFVFPGTDVSLLDVISDIPTYSIAMLGKGLSNTALLIKVGDKEFVLNKQHSPLARYDNKNQIYILSQLRGNPHFVQLLAAYVKDDFAFMINPYIPGKTLYNWLETPHTDEEKNLVLQQTKEAIDELHTFGIQHGDVHSENVFVPDDLTTYRVFLIDFGTSGFRNNLNNLESNYSRIKGLKTRRRKGRKHRKSYSSRKRI